MRHPREIDDLHHDDGPDPSWAGGEIEIDEQRPATALRSDPRQRKWMLLGVGGCAVVTAALVLLVTRGASPALAQNPGQDPSQVPGPAESAVEVAPAESAEPAATEASPATAAEPTLAAATRVAARPKQAPPPPKPASAAPPAAAPSPAKPASAPSPSKPAAAPPSAPALPSADSGDQAPAADLPDVEGWDDQDAAAEQDEAPAPAPAPEAEAGPEPAPADDGQVSV